MLGRFRAATARASCLKRSENWSLETLRATSRCAGRIYFAEKTPRVGYPGLRVCGCIYGLEPARVSGDRPFSRSRNTAAVQFGRLTRPSLPKLYWGQATNLFLPEKTAGGVPLPSSLR